MSEIAPEKKRVLKSKIKKKPEELKRLALERAEAMKLKKSLLPPKPRKKKAKAKPKPKPKPVPKPKLTSTVRPETLAKREAAAKAKETPKSVVEKPEKPKKNGLEWEGKVLDGKPLEFNVDDLPWTQEDKDRYGIPDHGRIVIGGTPDEQYHFLKLLKQLDESIKQNKLKYYNDPNQGKVHRKQVQFHSSLHRKKVLLGGNRTGKSVAGAVEAIWRARGNHPYVDITKPTDGWVISLTNEVQRDVAQRIILDYLNPAWIKDIGVRAGSKQDPRNSILDYLIIESVHGGLSRIGFKTAEQGREKFQGASLDWLWFDEESPREIYDEAFMRIIDRRGSLWLTMTPLKGLTYIYDLFYVNENNDPEVFCMSMAWEDNPWLSIDEIKALELTLSPQELEARRDGKFVALSGLVYPEFNPDVHVIDPFDVPTEWLDGIAIDVGYTHPTAAVFLAQDFDGDIYIIDEHWAAEKPVEWHAERIREKAAKHGYPKTNGGYVAIIDSAANQRTAGAMKSVNQMYAENGIYCMDADKSVWAGIQRVKEYLAVRPHPEVSMYPKGKPRLFVFKTCGQTIKEFKKYRWSETKGVDSKEEPKKTDDDMMDAVRYGLFTKRNKGIKHMPLRAGAYRELTAGEKQDFGSKSSYPHRPGKIAHDERGSKWTRKRRY